ncbi:MAG: hypothetical protein ACRCWS_03435 [Propionibacteriaceae bacterium]
MGEDLGAESESKVEEAPKNELVGCLEVALIGFVGLVVFAIVITFLTTDRLGGGGKEKAISACEYAVEAQLPSGANPRYESVEVGKNERTGAIHVTGNVIFTTKANGDVRRFFKCDYADGKAVADV